MLRYARTVRHLKAGQLVALVAARSGARSRNAPATIPSLPSPALANMTAEVAAWGYPWPREHALQLVSNANASRYTFAGTTRSFDEIDWKGRGPFPLWTYEFHYLEPLEALAWESRDHGDARAASVGAELMKMWQERAGGGIGWDAYPLSIRTVHWSQALLLVGDSFTKENHQRALDSLRAQIEHLRHRLETHLRANHLLMNLVSLSRVGLVFSRESVAWLPNIRAMYQRELGAQFAKDGAHEERTPTYHAILLRAALEEALLRRAAGESLGSDEVSRFARMMDADAIFRRSDGAVRLINDSVESATPPRSYLERVFNRLGSLHPSARPESFWLQHAAFAGISSETASCIIDVGEPSPPWQPGHAHCGALSFELDIGGRPLIVDSGVHGYDGDPLRDYTRSTRAHNTISIDGREQAEYWGTFRMARRWTIRDAEMLSDPHAKFAFRATVSPYWSRNVRHTREYRLLSNAFAVTDVIAGGEGKSAESFLHLHPDLSASIDGNRVHINSAQGTIALIEYFGCDAIRAVSGSGAPVQGWYCSDFGVRRPAVAIVARINRLTADHRSGFTISWT